MPTVNQEATSPPADSVSSELAQVELREVNEQLLIAGLREHTLVEQLGRQLAFTRAITTSLGEGVFAFDHTGRITFANPAAEHVLGWHVTELLGKDAEVIEPVSHARGMARMLTASVLHDVLRSGTTYRNDQGVFMRKDRTTFPVSYSIAPIIASDEVVGAVVVFRDMTEVRRLQQAQEEYLALMSHDLRAPLSVVLGQAQILLRQNLGQERLRTSLASIVASAQRMNGMIQDVLDRSLLEADGAELERVPVDLVQLFTTSVDHNIRPDQRTRLVVEGVAHLPVNADPLRIERVLVNLLINALKYSPPASPVVVRLLHNDRQAVVSIMDQGVGIHADDLVHVFEKHYRARTAGTTEGTGLGLYSSRLVIQAHGGQLWAESEVGVGSTFTFALPVGG